MFGIGTNICFGVVVFFGRGGAY